MNIYEAMTKIMKDIGAVGKDQKNQHQNYMFRGIDNFLNALHPCLVKHEVFMVPRVIDEYHELKNVIRGNGKDGIDKHVHLKVEYDFTSSDGTKITIGPITSEAIDTSDKATNKALSAALKYCLIQTFCIPLKDMEDSDRETIEIQPEKNFSNYDPSNDKREVTMPQLKRLQALVSTHEYKNEYLKEKLSELYNIDSSKKLNRAQYNELCNLIEKGEL